MKKFFISLLILITGAVCFAESDLQISTQPFSLYQYKYITWDNLKYMESLGFQYSGNVLVNTTASNVVEAQNTPETQWVDWTVSIDKSVKQFFAFYVKPYIGCTWNF